MAIGHRLEDEELSDVSTCELFSALGEGDTAVLFDEPFEVVTTFDIPFGAGNSIDRRFVYIDRTLFAMTMDNAFASSGLNPEQLIWRWIDHERTEKTIVDGSNPIDVYGGAHVRALRMEHIGVLDILGPKDAETKLKRYEQAFWPALEECYKRDPQRMPKDLWLGPMLDDPDDRGKELIRIAKRLGVIDADKRSKFEIHYGVGPHACRDCTMWHPEKLSQQHGALALCDVAAGLVRANRHCDFWHPKYRTGDDVHPREIGAQQAPDGEWYVPDRERPGKYLRVSRGRRRRAA